MRDSAVFLAVVVTLAACGEATAPAPFSIDLQADAHAGVIVEGAEGPVIRCPVELHATARGTGAAVWQEATFRFYYHGATVPADSQQLPSWDVRSAWFGDTITAGTSLTAPWEFWASMPFEAEVTFRFARLGDGPTGEVTTRFTCGLIPPPGTAAPTLSDLQILPAGGGIAPGDTITVTYSLASPFGVWASGVTLSGAVAAEKMFAERYVRSHSRIAQFVVPADLRPGVALSVLVWVVDPALQRDVRRIETALVLNDRTPPAITSAGLNSRPLAGQFAVGDTLMLEVTATDDNALEWLVYEIEAPANFRDSVRVAAGQEVSAGWRIPVVIRPEWVGAPVLSVRARDRSGHVSAPFSSLPDSIRFYPAVTPPTSVVAVLPSGFTTVDEFVHDPRRGVLYLNRLRSTGIEVLETATMTMKSAIEFPDTVGGFDLSISGDSLLVAVPSRRALAVVNLAQPTAAPGIIAIPLLDTAGSGYWDRIPLPATVRVMANGKAYVALSSLTRAGDQVVEVDLASGVQRLRPDSYLDPRFDGNAAARFTRAPDRSWLVFPRWDCLQRYTVATDAVSGCGDRTGTPTQITFDAAGTLVSYADRIFDAELRPVRRALPVRSRTPEVVLSPDGARAYLTGAGDVRVMRVSDGRLLERWVLPLAAERLFVSPDGASIIAFESGAQARAVRIDLR